MRTRWDPPFWVVDREFSAEDLANIQDMVYRCRRLRREEIVATVCENLPWKAPNGRLKVMACRQLLTALDAAQVIHLPPRKYTGIPTNRDTEAPPAPPFTLRTPLDPLRPITVDPVTAAERRTWNATVAAYHPLGYRRPIGAYQRYWIRGQQGADRRVILGALLFGAAAKAVRARDVWIGWTATERSRFRWRIVNNNRFLILPGVRVPHLASHILGLVARQVPTDWQHRYGYRPVLLETFVEAPWAGTCYRAANWRCVGTTAGRGRHDRDKTATLPVKTVWVYPLHRHWRTQLVAPAAEPPDPDGEEEDL